MTEEEKSYSQKMGLQQGVDVLNKLLWKKGKYQKQEKKNYVI